MYRFFMALIEMLAAAVFIVPALVIENRLCFHSWKRTAFYILFGLYLAAVLALVGFPNLTTLRVDLTVNLIPFLDLAADFKNACLNVLLFVPLGILLPVLWGSFRSAKRTVLAGLAVSFAIEFSQIFTFRTTDVNDLITNTAGAALGFLLARRLTCRFSRHVVTGSSARDFYIVTASVVLIMFFLQPYISNALWARLL